MGSFNPRINKGYNPVTKDITGGGSSTNNVVYVNITVNYLIESERIVGVKESDMTPKEIYETYIQGDKDYIIFAKIDLYDVNLESVIGTRIVPINISEDSLSFAVDFDFIGGGFDSTTWLYGNNPKDVVRTMTFRDISFNASGNSSLTNIPDNIVPLYYKIDDTGVIVSFFESSVDNNLGIHAIVNNGQPYTGTDTRGVLFYLDRN